MKKLGEGAAEESGIARRHARVPDAMTETFTVSPDMDIAAARSRGGGMQNNSNLGTSVKMKEYKKKLVAGWCFPFLFLDCPSDTVLLNHQVKQLLVGSDRVRFPL